MSKKKETQKKKGRGESVSIWIVEFRVIYHAHTQGYNSGIGHLIEAKCDLFSLLFCVAKEAFHSAIRRDCDRRRVRPCLPPNNPSLYYICNFIICSIEHVDYIFACHYNAVRFLCYNHSCKTVKTNYPKIVISGWYYRPRFLMITIYETDGSRHFRQYI